MTTLAEIERLVDEAMIRAADIERLKRPSLASSPVQHEARYNTRAARAALLAAVKAVVEDAERYRYLRQIDRSIEWENLLLCKWGTITGSEQIDAAIDAAKGVKP